MPEINVYVCPHCGSNGLVQGITPLVGNVRYDTVVCKCGATWRVYYQFENPKVEIMYKPEDIKAQGE